MISSIVTDIIASPDHKPTILNLGNVSVPLPPHRYHPYHNHNYHDDLPDCHHKYDNDFPDCHHEYDNDLPDCHHEYDSDDRRSLGQLSGGKRSLESEQTAISQVVLVVTWSNF